MQHALNDNLTNTEEDQMEARVFRTTTLSVTEHGQPDDEREDFRELIFQGEFEKINLSFANDTVNEESFETQPLPSQTRPRGRPRKTILPGKRGDPNNTSSAIEDNSECPTAQKRRRGRPRKTLDKQEQDSACPTVQKRRRGRPRKSVAQDQNCFEKNVNTGDIQSITSFPISTDAQTDKQERGRGKPKKYFDNSSDKTEFSASNSSEENVYGTAKKTLRKRKSHILLENENRILKKQKKSQKSDNLLNSDNELTKGKNRKKKLSICTPNRSGRPPGSANKTKQHSFVPKKSIENFHKSIFQIAKKQKEIGGETEKPQQVVIERKNLRKENGKGKGKRSIVLTRYIPKDRLEDSLVKLKDPNHPIWEERNTSCHASIHRHYEDPKLHSSDQMLRLKYARQCMLRRDWVNLSKVLALSSHDVGLTNYYPLLAKYGAICLAHTDRNKFNKLVSHVVNLDDGSSVLKKCTQFVGECNDE